MNLPYGYLDNAHIVDLASFKNRDAAIGKLLIDAGKLKPQDLKAVLKLQHEQRLRFGEAAMKLGFVTAAEVQHALSCQFDHPFSTDPCEEFSPELTVISAPTGKEAETLRSVRSQLLLRWFGEGRKTLAVSCVKKSEGASYIAANLAVLFAQLGRKTLLIDADMRQPSQHKMFNLGNGKGLSDILAGRAETTIISLIKSFPTLSVMPSGSPPPNPAELLMRPSFGALLTNLENIYDVILVDTPPPPFVSDLQIVAGKSGGVLISARRDVSRLGALTDLKEIIVKTNAQVIGVVMLD